MERALRHVAERAAIIGSKPKMRSRVHAVHLSESFASLLCRYKDIELFDRRPGICNEHFVFFADLAERYALLR